MGHLLAFLPDDVATRAFDAFGSDVLYLVNAVDIRQMLLEIRWIRDGYDETKAFLKDGEVDVEEERECRESATRIFSEFFPEQAA